MKYEGEMHMISGNGLVALVTREEDETIEIGQMITLNGSRYEIQGFKTFTQTEGDELLGLIVRELPQITGEVGGE